MKSMMKLILLVLMLYTASCSSAQSIEEFRKEILSDTSVSKEIKEAIRNGIIIKGMCPKEAFVAADAGLGPHRIRQDNKKWDNWSTPTEIILAQCKQPDDSIIEIKFHNKTQFKEEKDSVVFRVRFEKGRVVLIDQNDFSEDVEYSNE